MSPPHPHHIDCVIHPVVEMWAKEERQAVNPLDQQQEINHVGQGLPPAERHNILQGSWVEHFLQLVEVLRNLHALRLCQGL